MPAVSSTKYLVKVGWDDVPHLTPEKKADMLEACHPSVRMARSKGEPVVGMGRVWGIPWQKVICDPFPIPDRWPRCFGLDPGWKRTAVCWLARDPEQDVVYVYGEYYVSEMEPHMNALAIQSYGKWIPGVIDPSALKSESTDGKKLIDQYHKAGLPVRPAKSDVDSGVLAVWTRLKESRLKFFSHLQFCKYEFEQYHRDEKMKIVKHNDHLMDALRYAVMTGLRIAVPKAGQEDPDPVGDGPGGEGPLDPVAGY